VVSLCYLLPVARNIDRKELKNPDQFVSFWTRVGAFIGTHRLTVLGGAAALVVLGFGIWGVSTLMTKKSADVSRAFARIDKVASADLLPATGEPPKEQAEDGLPHFKTEQERLQAAIKEADTFIGAHGGSELKDEALLLKAKYLMALGKPTEALPIYQGQLGSLDKRLHFLAQEGLGYALEASGQIDAAMTAFAELATEADAAGGFYKDRALFHKARLLQQKGTAKDAEKLYREILEKTPTTPLKDEINNRLAALEGK
jgi:tetratricopeptide (TPR) repeat protein